VDLKSGYWQVPLHLEDKDKTASSTDQGLKQLTVMPLGPCKAPGTFEWITATVLKGLTKESSLSYLDDANVIGRTFQEDLFNLWKVSQQFRYARLKLKPEKRQFFQKEVRYLCHIV
jgi:hypothetical protein